MESQHITRRSALVGLASIATASGAVSTVAALEPPSEIMRLFARWDACYQRSWHVESDDESNAIGEEMRLLEAALMLLPATTAQEFAAKVVASSSYGDWTTGTDLIAEAAALCGAFGSSRTGAK